MKAHRFDPWSALLGLTLTAIGGLVLADRVAIIQLSATEIAAWSVPAFLVLLGILVLASAASSTRRARAERRDAGARQATEDVDTATWSARND